MKSGSWRRLAAGGHSMQGRLGGGREVGGTVTGRQGVGRTGHKTLLARAVDSRFAIPDAPCSLQPENCEQSITDAHQNDHALRKEAREARIEIRGSRRFLSPPGSRWGVHRLLHILPRCLRRFSCAGIICGVDFAPLDRFYTRARRQDLQSRPLASPIVALGLFGGYGPVRRPPAFRSVTVHRRRPCRSRCTMPPATATSPPSWRRSARELIWRRGTRTAAPRCTWLRGRGRWTALRPCWLQAHPPRPPLRMT